MKNSTLSHPYAFSSSRIFFVINKMIAPLLAIIFLILLGGIVWNVLLQTHNSPGSAAVIMATTSISSTLPLSPANNFSAWLWDAPDTFTTLQLQKMFVIARDESIKTVYVRVDDYIDIYQMKDSAAKKVRLDAFNESIRVFVTLARTYGIKVEALGGDVSWAEKSERVYPTLVFNGVIAYNKSHSADARLSGIQFDVEAHNSPAYKINKTTTLATYLDFVQEMINLKLKDSSTKYSTFTLGFAIPFWFDDQNNNGVTLTWGGYSKRAVVYNMIDILNKGTGGYIVLMDYRNYADGEDGAIDNAIDEITYSSKYAKNTKVIVGQETTDVLPRKITFFGKDKTAFKTESAKILKAFSTYPTFVGIAIHHLPSYIDL